MRTGGAVVWLGLLLILGIGAALRFADLGAHPLTHPEAFVPGIPWPDSVHNPPRADRVGDVLVNVRAHDVHPPGFYLAMYAWTRTFGSGLEALRLPAALAGIGAIAALFAVARRSRGPAVALLASALLALHGHHIAWSRHARMWSWLPLIALATTALMLSFERRPRRSLVVAWALLSVLGVYCEYYYLPFWGVQTAWWGLRRLRSARLPAFVDGALFVVQLSVPLLVLARFHARRPSHLESAAAEQVLAWIAFGNAFGLELARGEPRWRVGAGLLALAGLGCLIGAVRAAWQRARTADGGAQPCGIPLAPPGDAPARAGPLASAAWLAAGAALSSAATLTMFGSVASGRRFYQAALAAPWAIALARAGLDPAWRALAPRAARLAARLPRSARATLACDPLLVLALGPLLAMLAVQPWRPLLAQRGLLVALPFLLAVQVDGALALARSRRGRIVVAAALLAVGVVSWRSHARVPSSPRDYRALAERVIERIGPGDLVVVPDIWYATPVHYYLRPIRERVVTPEALRERLVRPSLRLPDDAPALWVLGFGEDVWVEQQVSRVEASLPARAGYRRALRLPVRGAGAIVLRPGGGAPQPPGPGAGPG